MQNRAGGPLPLGASSCSSAALLEGKADEGVSDVCLSDGSRRGFRDLVFSDGLTRELPGQVC